MGGERAAGGAAAAGQAGRQAGRCWEDGYSQSAAAAAAAAAVAQERCLHNPGDRRGWGGVGRATAATGYHLLTAVSHVADDVALAGILRGLLLASAGPFPLTTTGRMYRQVLPCGGDA